MRADLALVQRGLCESRARAREAIEAGLVRLDGRTLLKASQNVRPEADLTAEAPHPYVSRGGVKLAAALDAFGVDPAGRECLDVGASTGGFADVLLRRGATRVHAVDVGHGQLHPSLAGDPRVVAMEGTDARSLATRLPGGRFDLVTADVSFISLRLVLPGLVPLLASPATLIALVKPQFEAGRAAIGRGGIVRDEGSRQAALDDVVASAAELGFTLIGTMPCPLVGRDGNQEWLLAAKWTLERSDIAKDRAV